MTTYASSSDVQVRLGRPVPDTAQVEAWLTDVETIIRSRLPYLDEAVASGSLLASTVVMVEANAVVRRLLNPEGLRSVSVAVDDGTVTKTRDQALSDGVLRILDDEWALLAPLAASEAASVRLAYTPGWHDTGTSWGRP